MENKVENFVHALNSVSPVVAVVRCKKLTRLVGISTADHEHVAVHSKFKRSDYVATQTLPFNLLSWM